MKTESTLLLTRKDVAALLNIEDCISAVERAFKLYGEGKTAPPGILSAHAAEGGFHIKAGLMDLDRSYFVAKANANFPNNKKLGLPTIQGVIIVCDGQNGQVLALMDSIEISQRADMKFNILIPRSKISLCRQTSKAAISRSLYEPSK